MNERFTRAATRSDAARITAIYNQGIEDRVATFETEPRDAQQILRWFTEGYPVFVAGENQSIQAYAIAFPTGPGPAMTGSANSRFTWRAKAGAVDLARQHLAP